MVRHHRVTMYARPLVSSTFGTTSSQPAVTAILYPITPRHFLGDET